MDKLRTRVGDVAARLAQLVTMVRITLVGQSASPSQAERGQGLAEYALILALIAILAVSALAFLGGDLTGMFWDPINAVFSSVGDLIA